MKENRYLEYKREINDSFLKTVSAYANYFDGEIIFGIDDNGELFNLKQIDNLCLQIENKINDLIKPRVDYQIEVNKKTIRLKVFKGFNTPYLYKNKAYKRNDTSTIEVDNIELKRLILESENKSFDEVSVSSKDLSFKVLENKLRSIIGLTDFNLDIIKTLKLYDDKNGYNNAALLISDENSFPGIDIARFKDNSDSIYERIDICNCSVLKMLDDCVDVFNRYYSYEQVSDISRTKKFLVPFLAFKEAIANGLVHRNWDVSAKIRIAMFDDRIEIYSMGGLPNGMRVDEYLNGQISISRNPILANVFYRLNIIELFGTGIRRIKRAYEEYDVSPSFEVYDNTIKVILPCINKKQDINNDEKCIYDIFSDNRLLSRSDVVKESGFGKDKVLKNIYSLLEKEYLQETGEGRGRKYSKKKN